MKIITKTQYSHWDSSMYCKKAFTLVELIIVITILAILATIAFISFQKYIKDARDGNRISTLTQLQKWLELYAVKIGVYLKPDYVYASWYINTNIELFQVWQVKDSFSRGVSFSKTPSDPLSKDYYTYWLSDNKKYYQIAATLENWQSYVVGNYKWILQIGDMFSNPASLILSRGYSWPVDLENDIYFVLDKWQNLPYTINWNMTLTGIITNTTTWVTITKDTWMNTHSWIIQEIFPWVHQDTLWILVFWEKEYFNNIKNVWEWNQLPIVTCGSAHASSVSVAPTSNLCSDGTTPMVSGTWPWTWTCGGSTYCSASKSVSIWENVSTVWGQFAFYAGVYTGWHGKTMWVAGTQGAPMRWKYSDTETSLSTVNSTTNWQVNIDAIKLIDPTLASHPAVKYCDDLDRAWKTDWYLPAAHASNSSSTNCSNQLGEFQFLNCQHKWTGYQSLLGFESDWYYWSSTESAAGDARMLFFLGGQFHDSSKSYNYNPVRCVRVDD